MGEQNKQNPTQSDPTQPDPTQPDKDLASEERPVPSQAEGDRETVEQDLADKTKKEKKSIRH